MGSCFPLSSKCWPNADVCGAWMWSQRDAPGFSTLLCYWPAQWPWRSHRKLRKNHPEPWHPYVGSSRNKASFTEIWGLNELMDIKCFLIVIFNNSQLFMIIINNYSVLSGCQILNKTFSKDSHLISATPLRARWFVYYLHFADEKSEIGRGEVTCPRVHNQINTVVDPECKLIKQLICDHYCWQSQNSNPGLWMPGSSFPHLEFPTRAQDGTWPCWWPWQS